MDGITDSTDMSLSKLREIEKDREASPWGPKELDMTEQLYNNKSRECGIGAKTDLQIKERG